MGWFTDITVGALCGFLLASLIFVFVPANSTVVPLGVLAGMIGGVWWMRHQRA